MILQICLIQSIILVVYNACFTSRFYDDSMFGESLPPLEDCSPKRDPEKPCDGRVLASAVNVVDDVGDKQGEYSHHGEDILAI